MNPLNTNFFSKEEKHTVLTSSSKEIIKKRYNNTSGYFSIYDTNFNTYRKYRKDIKTYGIPFFPARFIYE